jgi:hypothetical protein
MSSGSTAQPQSWNRYTYCLNNPLLLVDPNGLIWGTYTKGDTIHYEWYENEDELKNAGATVVTNFVVNMLNGTWVALNPYANQHSAAESTPFAARQDLWHYTGLRSSLQDWVPVWGSFRRFMFNYAAGNYENALVNFGSTAAEAGSSSIGKALAGTGEVVTEATEQAVLRFSQTTASPVFRNGALAEQTIGEVANGLRSGALSPSGVPINMVEGADGIKLLVNTRSALALRRAGIAQESWTIIDLSANQTVRRMIQERLVNNGLTNQGTDVLRITGLGKTASNLK